MEKQRRTSVYARMRSRSMEPVETGKIRFAQSVSGWPSRSKFSRISSDGIYGESSPTGRWNLQGLRVFFRRVPSALPSLDQPLLFVPAGRADSRINCFLFNGDPMENIGLTCDETLCSFRETLCPRNDTQQIFAYPELVL